MTNSESTSDSLQLTGLYHEDETRDMSPLPKGWRLVLYLAVTSLRAVVPVIVIPVLGFCDLTMSFGMTWYWALLPAYLLGAYSLSITLLNAPIFFGQIPPLIGYRMKALYWTGVGSMLFIFTASPFVLAAIESISFINWLPWTIVCLISLIIPFGVLCVFGGLFLAPRIDSLKYEGGRQLNQ